jgi:hypothetical protein
MPNGTLAKQTDRVSDKGRATLATEPNNLAPKTEGCSGGARNSKCLRGENTDGCFKRLPKRPQLGGEA